MLKDVVLQTTMEAIQKDLEDKLDYLIKGGILFYMNTSVIFVVSNMIHVLLKDFHASPS